MPRPKSKAKGKEAQIASLVELLMNEPSLNNEIPVKRDKNSQPWCHKELFARTLENGRDLVHTCFVILDGVERPAKGETSKYREGLQDELLKCLLVLHMVVQRQTKWRNKSRLKQYWHSRRYKRELQDFCAQFRASKERIHAGFNPYQRKKIGLKIPIILEAPAKFTSEPLVGQSRAKILQELDKKISKESRQTTMVALVGGAGTGKSHIAGQFVRKWMNQKSNEKDVHRTVFWLSAQTEESLREGYVQILNQANEETPRIIEKSGIGKYVEISTMQLARQVWNKLECLSALGIDWLVVLDHVPEVLDGLQGAGSFLPFFFPTCLVNDTTAPSRGSILFTTRSAEFDCESRLGVISPIAVNALSDSEAVAMLTARLSDDCKDCSTRTTAAMIIADIFGPEESGALPLAVVTLANDIESNSKACQGGVTRAVLVSAQTKATTAIMESIEPVLKHLFHEGDGQVLTALGSWHSPHDLNALEKQNVEGEMNYMEEDGMLMCLDRLFRLGIVQWDDTREVYTINKLYQLAIQAYLGKRRNTHLKRKKSKVVRFASCLKLPSFKHREEAKSVKQGNHAIPDFILLDFEDRKLRDSLPPSSQILHADDPNKYAESRIACSEVIRDVMCVVVALLTIIALKAM